MSAAASLEPPDAAKAASVAPRRKLPRPKVAPKASRWVRAQSVNLSRHAANLRPFGRTEFGEAAASPSPGHILATNRLIAALRERLMRSAGRLTDSAKAAGASLDPALLDAMLRRKQSAHSWVQAMEKVWEFYFQVFSQRQTRFGLWLVACDRISLDCYQCAFTGLGVAKSIPAPPPLTYMQTGQSPATFRRGIFLRRLGQHNPFPLVQLPYHRLLNPWTLGAILHEVSHNLQNELGLHKSIPRNVYGRLIEAGLPGDVAKTWRKWNRETFADMSGGLLGGPAVVASLMDVIARSSATAFGFSSRSVHPTPYLRAFISYELLRRLGFGAEADRFEKLWRRLYPDPSQGSLPAVLLRSAPRAIPIVVDTMCFQKYKTLGGKALAEVIRFGRKEQQMTEEAARRLAAGVDPGILPERHLIGAARVALDRRLARPEAIARNFYRDLGRR